MENLAILTKYEGNNKIYPIEKHDLCLVHYEKLKENYKKFELNKIESSIPNIWCEVCNPVN